MLADEDKHFWHAGGLRSDLHLHGEWLSSLIAFIAAALPGWRDDPRRPAETGETILTAQLCAHLNGLTRRTRGWDYLQFKREEPDETHAVRSIDMAVAPSSAVLWIEGREYTEYQTLLPIECKRLPTPPGHKRDEREYLYNRFNTTGGVQRFKAGHHAAVHARAAMIGYVQSENVKFWKLQLDQWVEDLVSKAIVGWSVGDKLKIDKHDAVRRILSLRSEHIRMNGLPPINLDHMWIEM